MRRAAWGVISMMAVAAAMAVPRDAVACGGCFHAGTDTSTSFVTDHRMVLSISTKQTVLWDQVRYTGDPSEFAWVLPVHEGAELQLARDEWIEALDTATRPAVKGPDISCGGAGGGGSMGCGFSQASFASSDKASPTAASGGYQNGAGVEVVSQSVVGPYETVTLRASRGDALHVWLRINGFSVPDAITPVLAYYTQWQFDFIALKLRPNAGVRQMRPVRVVMPGASTTLPLRMVAAGVGAKVGLTLFVVTEGRYHPKNFPDQVVDRSKLAWNFAEQRSNYRELAAEALAQTSRAWLTEYAGKPFVGSARYANGAMTLGGAALSRPLDELYRSACRPGRVVASPGCVTTSAADAGAKADGAAPGKDAGSNDASADGAAASDAAVPNQEVDAAPPSPPPCPPVDDTTCASFDDDVMALDGLHKSDVWVTRLRAELSASECAAGDLEVEPAPEQVELPAVMKTDTFTDPNVNPCNGISSNDSNDGCACRSTAAGRRARTPLAFAAFAALGVLRYATRRRRRPPR